MESGDSDKIDWQVLSVKVQPDLHERIEDHKETGDYSTNSENVRALFRKGLDADRSGGVFLPNRRILLLGALVLIMLVNPSPPEPLNLVLGGIGILFACVAGVLEISHWKD